MSRKIMKKFMVFTLISLTLVVFSYTVAFCEEPWGEKNEPHDVLQEQTRKTKDPFIAGLLSWFMMGVGQIYVQEYTKGSILIAADLIDRASLVLLVAHINKKYAPSDNQIINVNWGEFNTGTKVLIISYFAASVGLRFYSAIDAYRSAVKYNDRYTKRNTNAGLSFDVGYERIFLGYCVQFNE
jgi:hypothetical protein